MKKQCKICSSTYDSCNACSLTKNSFKSAGYCCENCYHISMILQRYGSKMATASETLKALKPYGIDKMSLQPKIAEYYQKIVNEAKPKLQSKIIEEIIPQKDVEVVVEANEDMTISDDE